ncbi:MAG: [acyl-carrier-protein] S-malonyltransferase [Gammaproteobacteria bacterium]
MSLITVFPGQGSQSLGMLADLADNAVVKATFDQARDAIGIDLWAISQDGPEAELNKTENTQPALLAASVALWRAWLDQGGEMPIALAGHSLGEYSALVAAGAIEFADAVRLVKLRGELMQLAVPAGVGGMAAVIGMEDNLVIAMCDEITQNMNGESVSAANFNAPGQVVVAGSAAAVAQVVERGKEYGARMVKPLAVSVPSHCALMQPVAEQFADALAAVKISLPSIPVIQNVDAAASTSVDEIRSKLKAQLSDSVRWVACMNTMIGMGATRCIELGPGNVLSGLNKRIAKTAGAELKTESINSAASLASAIA